MKIAGIMILCASIAGVCFGQVQAAPEIDPASGLNAIALLTGALLMIRGRRRR
jgi:hypothetical protein